MAILGMNRVILVGEVAEVPTVHRVRGGARPPSSRTRRVLRMRLRTKERVDDGSGLVRDTNGWHTVVVWGAYAEALAPHLQRGTQIAVEGRLVSRHWHHPRGTRNRRTEIDARRIVFLPVVP